MKVVLSYTAVVLQHHLLEIPHPRLVGFILGKLHLDIVTFYSKCFIVVESYRSLYSSKFL